MPARRALQHPARLLPLALLTVIVIGTVLLMLPVSRPGGEGATFVAALFTATSATCITGLAVVETPTYWSPFGQVVILTLIQVGGFGIMGLATLIGVFVTRRLGLTTRLLAQAESKTLTLGEVRRILTRVALIMLTFELVLTVALTLRLALGHGYGFGKALWHGVFHSVSAFNNAGFALYGDSLERFVSDPWITLPVAAAVIAGGLGFPVLIELTRHLRRPGRWSLHTKVTLFGTALLLPIGMLLVLALEWSNPATFGPLGVPDKLLAGFFQGMTPRSSGFNTVDYDGMSTETWTVTTALMFIGGGSASTAGGIKVTTFFLLGFVILAEVRGDQDVAVFDRRLPVAAQRQALSIALLGVGVVGLGTLALIAMTGQPLDRALFEVTSAATTTGLSTGITSDLTPSAQLLLAVLMFVGRVGPAVAAAALALRSRRRFYRLPEGRPIIG
ncbi:MAG: TrkH family potassium uptake protein [Micromonosporaceae bacterium]|nr:TrkH family potassium uptake protein [Micromonosporaceae bacterium]